MSAHDDLMEHGLTVDEVANVLEKHAHELAEKIRQSAPCHGGFHHYDDGECHRTFDAADLIDPHYRREPSFLDGY